MFECQERFWEKKISFNGFDAKQTLEKVKPCHVFNSKSYLLEESIFADVAVINAWKSDTMGEWGGKTTTSFEREQKEQKKV